MSGAATGGLLAARAGMKSAASSAVMGGIILAAIEGLNIAVQRVIVPYFENQAQQSNQIVDLLEPPIDIYASKPLYSLPPASPSYDNYNSLSSSSTSSSTSPSGSGSISKGFDIDSISQYDTSNDWKGDNSANSSDGSSNSKDSKPWWKPF